MNRGAEPNVSEEVQVSIYSVSGDLTPQLKEKSPASWCIPHSHNGELRQVLKTSEKHVHLSDFLGRNLRRQMPENSSFPGWSGQEPVRLFIPTRGEG